MSLRTGRFSLALALALALAFGALAGLPERLSIDASEKLLRAALHGVLGEARPARPATTILSYTVPTHAEFLEQNSAHRACYLRGGKDLRKASAPCALRLSLWPRSQTAQEALRHMRERHPDERF